MDDYLKITISELNKVLTPTATKKAGSQGPQFSNFVLKRRVGLKEFQVGVHTVWLQGYVQGTCQLRDSVQLVDNDGEKSPGVVVCNCSKAPGFDYESMKIGNYLQVLGKIQGIDTSGRVRVNALKVIDLSKEDVLKQAWTFEVEDFKIFSSSRFSP